MRDIRIVGWNRGFETPPLKPPSSRGVQRFHLQHRNNFDFGNRRLSHPLPYLNEPGLKVLFQTAAIPLSSLYQCSADSAA